MDDVPVKIVDRYKPPPLIYQLPQTIVNRLAQKTNGNHDEANQYDFQLERSVLNQCQQWRRMRQQQQQARHSRQELRKQERQRALEAKQREMLGAVEYPSAADLSSDSDDDDDDGNGDNEVTVESSSSSSPATTATKSINTAESREQQQQVEVAKSINSCNNFNDILQPTKLSGMTPVVVAHHKRNSSLNYADFEYNMNSTPFDNIELKTINDLDILAQVLHQTQLTQNLQAEQVQQTPPDEQPEQEQNQDQVAVELELAVTTLEETKATLDSVNFQLHCDDAPNIPAMYPAPVYNTPQQLQPQQQPHSQPVYQQMIYTQQHFYGPQQHQQLQLQQYQNHNYLQHATHATPVAVSHVTQALLQPQDAQVDAKSRSVPDILRELKSELQQAEKRRARLHSHHNENELIAEESPTPSSHESHELQQLSNANNVFQELEAPQQQLAQRISSMGFPLERVAKVISLCGIDDKKIIEHLIPQGELLDLGFDETKISAALVKFDNNKDKALDYLIK